MIVTISVYKGRGENPIALESFHISPPSDIGGSTFDRLMPDASPSIAEEVWAFMTRDRGVPISSLRFVTTVKED